jgi:ribosomal protein S18 acetylase RimI-like enzyme
MTDPSGALTGFYALNAHAIDYSELPTKCARTRPGHGSIPAAYISMIGVDARHQGHGYGGDLLVDALTRIIQAADAIGIAVVILDVLDDGDAEQVARRKLLYQSYGFQPLPSRPLRLYLPLATLRQLIGA